MRSALITTIVLLFGGLLMSIGPVLQDRANSVDQQKLDMLKRQNFLPLGNFTYSAREKLDWINYDKSKNIWIYKNGDKYYDELKKAKLKQVPVKTTSKSLVPVKKEDLPKQ